MGEKASLDRIIAGCKRGEHESFSLLLEAYSGRCHGYFYRLTGDRHASDDLLSELFVKLIEKIGGFKDGNFDAWLFKIAHNIFHDWLRDKKRQEKLVEQNRQRLIDERRDSKESLDPAIDALQTQLQKLDPDTKELIMMRFYSQASFKELAAMRAEPIGTTLSKLHRGLKKLAELMEN
jgi:RNA polymerase sigma-70 factor, ECF subfamily